MYMFRIRHLFVYLLLTGYHKRDFNMNIERNISEEAGYEESFWKQLQNIKWYISEQILNLLKFLAVRSAEETK